MLRALLVAAVLAIALAGAPTVDVNYDLFPQNFGTLVVHGSGFVRFDPEQQFNLILRNDLDVWHSNAALRGGVGVVNSWTGCIPSTLEVNVAGNTMTCTLEYIPDYVIEASGAGTTTLEIDVVNENGALREATGPQGVVIAVIENVDERIFFSNENEVPPVIYGLSVIGRGFPAPDSLAVPGHSFTLTIDHGGITPYVIDVWASTYSPGVKFFNPAGIGSGGGVSSLLNFDGSTSFITAGTAQCECSYDKDRVDCGFCSDGGTDGFVLSTTGITPAQSVTVTFTINGMAAPTPVMLPAPDTIGPSNIATVALTQTPIRVDNDGTEVISWNEEEIVIHGAGFIPFPSIQSNIIAWVDTSGGGAPGPTSGVGVDAPFKCVPTFVSTAGHELRCRPNVMPPENAGAAPSNQVPLEVIVVAGSEYGFDIDPTLGATTYTVAQIDVSNAVDIRETIAPNSAPLQADARFLTLRSRLGGFPVDAGLVFDPSSTDFSNAPDPTDISTVVTLTGIEAGSTQCRSRYPNYADAFTTIGSLNPACQIVSMTRDEIVIRLPPITQPVGTSILADLTTTWNDITGSTSGSLSFESLQEQVVGVVAPGAGVGGDPHFFGFLGEKYEFAGEVGQTYNILTDEDVQLNAVIGKWHFAKGSETIIKTLALKTLSHRLLIDAGGNYVGSPSFSIMLDGEPLMPNETDATILGRDGWVRWSPLDPNDSFRLPLWEKHNGVALVQIVLNNYEFQILAIEEGRNSKGEWHHHPGRFLDFMCKMFDSNRRPHGLFGQTAHLDGRRSAEGFSLQGSDSDYKVSEPFGDDFPFNQFQG